MRTLKVSLSVPIAQRVIMHQPKVNLYACHVHLALLLHQVVNRRVIHVPPVNINQGNTSEEEHDCLL
jgi:hypothetical protein